MTTKKLSAFLDTSVIFFAILSPTGGSRKLFYIGEAGILQLLVGPVVLREIEQVVQRKAPGSIPEVAKLLASGGVEIVNADLKPYLERARRIVQYQPDAYVLAEAISVAPDWFITHDREHFLKSKTHNLPFQIGTPGDLIQALSDQFPIKR